MNLEWEAFDGEEPLRQSLKTPWSAAKTCTVALLVGSCQAFPRFSNICKKNKEDPRGNFRGCDLFTKSKIEC